jgi:outer membrane protein assembly factor BamB
LGTEIPPLSDEAILINLDDDLVSLEFSQFVGGYLIQQTSYSDPNTASLRAIGIANGQIAWSHNMISTRGYATDGELLYVASYDGDGVGSFKALNLATGETVWSQTAPGPLPSGGANVGPVYSDGIVYFT